jgi:hypothetical protein
MKTLEINTLNHTCHQQISAAHIEGLIMTLQQQQDLPYSDRKRELSETNR